MLCSQMWMQQNGHCRSWWMDGIAKFPLDVFIGVYTCVGCIMEMLEGKCSRSREDIQLCKDNLCK